MKACKMLNEDYTILGAGISGLSASYHLGHDKCKIYEANSYAGGHAYTHRIDSVNWDEGPHISFTKNEYVKKLFEESTQKEFSEFAVDVSNYYFGDYIPHPAQSNLSFLKEPLRTQCYEQMLSNGRSKHSANSFSSYLDWLKSSFGEVFTKSLPERYTKKYWTVEAAELAVDWVGERVFRPDLRVVENGYRGIQAEKTHYIDQVRYPKTGGFVSFLNKLQVNANIKYSCCVDFINLEKKQVYFRDGAVIHFKKLINTLPLPEFIVKTGAPLNILEAAKKLDCTSLLLVNIVAKNRLKKNFHWMYVYDDEMYSTRITSVNSLTPGNKASSPDGIQVEVYESKFKPFNRNHTDIAKDVIHELQKMGIIDSCSTFHTKYILNANIIFNHRRRENQDLILNWLVKYGLHREADDLEPMSSWTHLQKNKLDKKMGDLILAGRFGQWKYFWSDDCVLRGLEIGMIDKFN
jgi:protoporphyrinogen oxidase